MATTPRPYLWQFCVKRAEGINSTGGVIEYFTGEAQSLYLHNGITEKDLTFSEGHWESAVASNENDLQTDAYSQMSLTHPATGSVYGSAIKEAEETNTLYLLRYTYAKDMGKFVSNGNYRAQVDNPIIQVNIDVKNWNSDAFTKQETLFIPGAKMYLGITMGDSNIYDLCEAYVDAVDFQYSKATVQISGRNRLGHLVSVQTINAQGKMTGTIKSLCEWVLTSIGIDRYVVADNSTTMTLEYAASDTGMSLLDKISDKASGYETGSDWAVEEMPDGTIIIGYNAFRGQYLPKSVFKYGMSELFKRSSSKSIDGAYSKIYCTGKDSNGNDLTPVIEDVTTWRIWTVASNKTYFPAPLENVTQAQLADYAKTLAKQLKRTGLNEVYSSTIRPQLLVGDYATIVNGESEKDIGVITQVTHNFGEKGFKTEFCADSGGNKQAILTRSADSDEKVYTSSRRNGGNNRAKQVLDFIRNTAVNVVRTYNGGGGGSQATGVQDVLVDGTSVVSDNVANIDLTGKQNALTAGDRITITSDVISSDIAPFSIVDGKMCITYKGEVE